MELVRRLVPVPEIVRTAPSADPPWSLMTFVAGGRMDLALTSASAQMTKDMTFSAGRALARIHQVKFSRAGFLDEQLQVGRGLGAEFRWHTFLHSMFDRKALRDNVGQELADRLRGFVDGNMALEQQMSFGSPVLSHSDYKPWNLLVSESDVAAVLDWEFAFAGARH